MRTDNNERMACAAALRVLSPRMGGGPLRVTDRPDETERTLPAIEAVATNGSRYVVLEHTKVESFPQQIKDDVRVNALFPEVEKRLGGRLPADSSYRVVIDVNVLPAPSRQEALVNKIVDEVVAAAPSCRFAEPGVSDHEFRLDEDKLGFPVGLIRYDFASSHVFCVRRAPVDLEQQRAARLQDTVDRKLPKLRSTKRRYPRSVSSLVIENADGALANSGLIAGAIFPGLLGRDDCPDYVILVNSACSTWYVELLLEHGTLFPSGPNGAKPHIMDIDDLKSDENVTGC